jgi:type IV pilus assembly protein PilA
MGSCGIAAHNYFSQTGSPTATGDKNFRSEENQRRLEMKSKQKGFSLIELLIVVAIILIIAAIAIPNLLKSRMSANESSAVGSERTLNTAEITYAASCPDAGYAASIIEMNTGALCSSGSGIIDDALASSTKSGYTFAYTVVAGPTGLNSNYTIAATPVQVGTSGNRGFFSDETGVIRYTLDGSAPTVASSPLQ